MAGYKQSIIKHDPILFLTFDGDQYDDFTRKLVADPQVFIDESQYATDGILHNESEAYPAYRMGLPSLVDLEPTDQKSVSFGWYGYQPNAPTRWPKSFIEVPHKDYMTFREEDGSFTVSFMVTKETDESHWRSVENSLGGPYASTLIRPWVRKQNVFHIWYQDNWVIADRIHAQYPSGTLQWDVPAWFYTKRNMVTFTWHVWEKLPNEWIGDATLYVNGRIVAQAQHSYLDTPPTSNYPTPIEIAGTIEPGGTTYNDRATTNTILDQIAIFNKPLIADEVAALFKKTKTYDNLILSFAPTYYWPMNDAESSLDTNMIDMTANGRTGQYIGGPSKVVRQASPPPQRLDGASVQFVNGGTAVVHYYPIGGLYGPVFNPTADFSVEFWLKFDNSNRSTVFALQRDDSPYPGILIEANRRAGVNQPGHIQFSITQDNYVDSLGTQDNGQPYNFADGRFHHVVALRRGTFIELWIDGKRHTFKDFPIASVPSPGPGQIYLMGSPPGSINTSGSMSSLAMYAYALDPQEIRARNLYSQIYRIQGAVTLEGVPYQATVRALSHRHGSLVREVLSNPSDGAYKIDLYDNTLIDIMALNKNDRNVRYRVFGPITPAVYNDLP